MREHVKVLAVREPMIDAAAWAAPVTEFEKAVTGLRVVPLDQRNKFEPREVWLEVPIDLMTKVVLPNVENTPHGGVHRCAEKLAAIGVEMNEMAVRPRLDGRIAGADV